jgi:hypothetical protein
MQATLVASTCQALHVTHALPLDTPAHSLSHGPLCRKPGRPASRSEERLLRPRQPGDKHLEKPMSTFEAARPLASEMLLLIRFGLGGDAMA